MAFLKSVAAGVLFVASMASVNAAGPWQQCGGLSMKDGKDQAVDSCDPGYSCKRLSAWYWQCNPSQDPLQPNQKAPYQQCGGVSLPGGADKAMYDCTPGYYCKKYDQWYWQCIPKPSNSNQYNTLYENNDNTQQIVGSYQQCGGINLGGKDAALYGCNAGWTCKKQNEYYWQCVPGDNPPVDNQKGKYEQCGGKNMNGGSGTDSAMFPCVSGFSCTRNNEYYWQCTPIQYNGLYENQDLQTNSYSNDLYYFNAGGEYKNAVNNYGQCGGLNLPNGKDEAMNTCNEGYVCTKLNPYYWQCVPSNTPPVGNQKGQYEQCGGRSLPNGEDKALYGCVAGFQCSRGNEWYWQCVPKPQNAVNGQVGAHFDGAFSESILADTDNAIVNQGENGNYGMDSDYSRYFSANSYEYYLNSASDAVNDAASGLGTTATVLIIVGAAIVVACVTLLVVLIIRGRRRRRAQAEFRQHQSPINSPAGGNFHKLSA